MRLIADEGRGVLVLLRDVTMRLQADGEVSPQTLRQYGLGAQILSALGGGKDDPSDQFAQAEGPLGLEATGSRFVGTRQDIGDRMMAGTVALHPAAAGVREAAGRFSSSSAPFYRDIADALNRRGAAEIEKVGGSFEVVEVPGALEVPTAIRIGYAQGDFRRVSWRSLRDRGETTPLRDGVATLRAGRSRFWGCRGRSSATHSHGGDHEQAAVRATPRARTRGGGAGGGGAASHRAVAEDEESQQGHREVLSPGRVP